MFHVNMIWYPLFLLLIFIISIVPLRENKKAIYLCGLLFLISAFRYGMSYDYFIYTQSIYTYKHIEPIPAYLETLAEKSWMPLFFILTSAIISVCFFSAIIRKSAKPLDSLFFYIGYPMLYITHLSTVRQAMATGFIFLALLIRNKDVKSIAYKIGLIILASLSHLSGIMGVLVFMPISRLKRIFLLIAMILSFFIGEIMTSNIFSSIDFGIVSSKLITYMETEMSGHSLERLLLYALTFFLFMNHKRIVRIKAENDYYLKCIYVGVILFNLFSINFHMAIRFYCFFASPILLVIPYLYRLLHVPTVVYRILCIFALALSIWSGYVQTKDSGYYHFYPYTSVFEIPESQYSKDAY